MRHLIALAAIAFAVGLASAPPEVSAADHPFLLPPSDRERAEKLQQAEDGLRGKERSAAMFLAAVTLAEWRRYVDMVRVFSQISTSTGPNPQAIREYQAKRLLKPTGAVDAATLARLMEDSDLIRKLDLAKAINLPGLADPLWHSFADVVTVEGTWVITNASSAQPLQTSTLICERAAGDCRETTVSFDDNGYLFVSTTRYTILSWLPDGVRAASSSAMCADYMIHIRRVEKKVGEYAPGLVTGHRVVKAGGQDLFGKPCESTLTEHLSLRLDKGHEVQQRYRQELWKALGLPDPPRATK